MIHAEELTKKLGDLISAVETIGNHLEAEYGSEEDREKFPNVAAGLFAIARSLQFGAKHLGKEDAEPGGRGAIEALGECWIQGCEKVADAISGGLQTIAEAIAQK